MRKTCLSILSFELEASKIRFRIYWRKRTYIYIVKYNLNNLSLKRKLFKVRDDIREIQNLILWKSFSGNYVTAFRTYTNRLSKILKNITVKSVFHFIVWIKRPRWIILHRHIILDSFSNIEWTSPLFPFLQNAII